jgi:broad specificity phosphatase PhoE
MKLYIVRHGETLHNRHNIIQGQYDVRLSGLGKRQADAIARRLSVVDFDRIFSSDLSRAAETAQTIKRYQRAPVKYANALRERDFGPYNNKPVKLLEDKLNELGMLGTMRSPKGVETFPHFFKRVSVFLDRIYAKHRDETVLLVTHGGVKRMSYLHLKNLPLDTFHIKTSRSGNTALTVVSLHKDRSSRFIIENDVSHLS